MQMFRILSSIIALSIIAGSFSCHSQEMVEEAQIDEAFMAWDDPNIPGMAVGVVSKGKMIFSKGYGSANLEHNIPISPASIFDIASVSKQFAGIAIAMLIKEGKLSEDDDIKKYLPDLPDYGHTITVGNLLHHTSGLRDWPTLLIAAGYMMEDVISFDLILSLIYAQKELNFVPGEEYVYSNSNYSLLVQIHEKITGDKFDSWTRNNIFKPLGMKNSHFHLDYRRLVKNRVDSYAPAGFNVFINIPNNLCGIGSSSLYTSVEDLSKWVINFGSPKVGGTEVIEMMTRGAKLNNGEPVNYGFGIATGDYKGQEKWSHSGGWAGFRTYLCYMPDLEFGVIVLSNHAAVNPTALSNRLIDLYYPDLEDDAEVAEEDGNTEFDPFKEAEFNSAMFKALEGSYELEAQPGFIITISSEGDKYYSQATGQQRISIFPSSDSTFFAKVVKGYLTFHKEVDGSVDHITLHQNGLHKGNRVKEKPEVFEPSPEELKLYTGDYKSEELSTVFSIKVPDENLLIDHVRHGQLYLKPLEKDKFQTIGMPGEIRYERDESGEITGFRLSMMPRTRNILFEKVSHVP